MYVGQKMELKLMRGKGNPKALCCMLYTPMEKRNDAKKLQSILSVGAAAPQKLRIPGLGRNNKKITQLFIN